MTIGGEVIPITTEPSEYAEAGIHLKDPPGIQGFELMRLLAPR
jgi:hypothetical protein